MLARIKTALSQLGEKKYIVLNFQELVLGRKEVG